MISSDLNILKEGSDVRERMREYGSLVDELHIIVLNQKSKIKNQKFGNVFIYPTNSFSKWFYIVDAYNIARNMFHASRSLFVQEHSDWQQTAVQRGRRPSRGFTLHDLLITAQDPFETGLAGWLIARRNNTPLQVQVHTDFLNPYFARESLLNRIRVLIAKFLLPRATGIRVVSERIKNSLVSCFMFHASRIDVLPIFVDTERLKNAPVKTDLRKKYPQFDFIVLMASRLTKEKNIPLAIEAMREIIKKHPQVGLVIVGEGSEKESLTFHVSRFTLQESIVFDPWTNDLASYYKTADLFLLTSAYEGYGRTVVEAQACGLPVVMTNVGIAGDFIINQENGLVVPVGDASALVNAILSIKEKKVILKTRSFHQTKTEYLEAYRRAWEACLRAKSNFLA